MKKSNTLKILSIGKEKRSGKLSIFIEREIKAFDKGDFPLEIKGVALSGKGILSYIRFYFQLRKIIRKELPDIVHAHYSFIGVIAILASPKRNVVVTFLGSDAFLKTYSLKLAKWLVTKKATHIIVVSNRIYATFAQQKNVSTIPHGVDLDLFKPMDKKSCSEELDWDTNRINILFPSSHQRFEKNYNLAKESVQKLKLKFDIDFHTLEDIDPNQIPTYLNAADIVLLTSKWEGSSNVTKEAMACNTIVVSTDVGDARELFKDTPGYYLTNHTVEDVLSKLKEAIAFRKVNRSTQGRQCILELGLDDVSTAKKIFEVYKKTI